MQAQRRNLRLPNFEACSLALIAFAAMINAPHARAQVGFGPAGTPAKSAPSQSTPSQAVTPAATPASGTKAPAPKPQASSATKG